MALPTTTSVWDPHLKKDIERLEGVQKFGLKVSLKQWRCGYEDLLQLANLPTLASRRKHLKLCLLYSMVNELATFPKLPTIFRSTPYNSIQSINSSSHGTATCGFKHLFKLFFFPSCILDCGTVYLQMLVLFLPYPLLNGLL